MKAIYRILQWLFILILLTTSMGKLLDNRGFAEVISTYQMGIPESQLLAVALSVSLIELFFAIRLYQEKHQHQNAWALVLIHSGYLSLAAITIIRGIELRNCGCFGVFLARPLTQQTLVEDSVLTALSLLFVWVVKLVNK
ncbi:MAG: MauE/DoxX family redox-associated membrane protein [Methylococcales bacterium]